MTNIETLLQTVKDRLQEEYNEGGFISQDTVHEICFEEFEEMGGAEAFEIDEDEVTDLLVDDIIGNITLQL